MKILENNNKSNNLEENLILVETIPIKEYTYNRLVVSFGGKFTDYITTIEMSKIWGISSRRISLLCSQGRVPGAEKKGKTWLIPKDAVKPTDPRKKNR